jgi:hypothetical protein
VLAFGYLSIVVPIAKDAGTHHASPQIFRDLFRRLIVLWQAFSVKLDAMLQCCLTQSNYHIALAADNSLL